MEKRKLSKNEALNIVITGASSGIGETIALEMAKDKHHFFLTARNQERLSKVAENLDKMGCQVHYQWVMYEMQKK